MGYESAWSTMRTLISWTLADGTQDSREQHRHKLTPFKTLSTHSRWHNGHCRWNRDSVKNRSKTDFFQDHG